MVLPRSCRGNRHRRYVRKIGRNDENGYLLATLFMVIFLAMIAAFVFVNSSIFHMNTVQRVSDNEQAKNMAESVVAEALEKVMANQSYGKSTSTTYNDEPLKLKSNGYGNSAVGLLTFNSSKASSVENPITKDKVSIPWSFNNLECDASKDGCGRTVPRFAVHLVGTGISNGVVRRIEAVVHIPPFPYAIASSGKFESGDGLLVAGVKKPEDAFNGASMIAPENLIPSHIASNSRDVKAVKLGSGTKITGNVRASGGIETDPHGGTNILGQMLCNADPVALPRIDVTTYDPITQGMEGVQTLPASMDAQTLEGAGKRAGNLTVNGDLTLDGALVYINGDLTIHGGVKGKGGLFVTGKTVIDCGSSLDTSNAAVLMSKGDITLGGIGKESSAFQGLIYTEGNLKAEKITLLGALVTNAAGKGTSTQIGTVAGDMAVNNVNMVYVPEYLKADFDVKTRVTNNVILVSFGLGNNTSIGLGGQPGVTGGNNPSPNWFTSIQVDRRFDSKTNRFLYNGYVAYGRTSPAAEGGRYDFGPFSGDNDNLYNAVRDRLAMNPPGVTLSENFLGTSESAKNFIQALHDPDKAFGDSQATDTVVKHYKISIDLNRFINLQDKMRMLLWKEWEPK
jgi:Tfp pilus assembly protein PilX